jgi:hypothetical protein
MDNWEAAFPTLSVRRLRGATIEELFSGIFCADRAEVL